MGAELSWRTHHPLLSDRWKGQDPLHPHLPDPLDTEEESTPMECGRGQVKRSAGVKEAPWRHSRPLGCAVSFKSVCWQKSDNNFGSCAVFCLAAEIIFTERTSLLIKPSILFKSLVVFCSFLLFGLPLHARNSFRREFRASY